MELALEMPIEERLSVPDLIDVACHAEATGYHRVLVGEVNGPDSLTLLGGVASATDRIVVGTGVIPTPVRSVALTAMAFATLASMAPGRVMAGFGAGAPGVIESWHGRPFPSPVTAMREFVNSFRRLMAGEASPEGFQLAVAIPPTPVPVMLGAVGPRMLGLAGELADEVFLTLCPVSEVADRMERVRGGEARAGRRVGDVAATVLLFASPGRDPAAERDRMRRLIARYAAVPTHRRALASVVATDGGPVERESLSDAAVDALLAVGRDAVAARLHALDDAGTGAVAVIPLPARRGDLSGVTATIDMVAAARSTTPGDDR